MRLDERDIHASSIAVWTFCCLLKRVSKFRPVVSSPLTDSRRWARIRRGSPTAHSVSSFQPSCVCRLSSEKRVY